MTDTPRTTVTLTITRDGNSIEFTVVMSGDDLKNALASGGTLVALPTGEGRSKYVNHVPRRHGKRSR